MWQVYEGIDTGCVCVLDSKSHKSSKKGKSSSTIDGFPKSSKGELDWNQKVCITTFYQSSNHYSLYHSDRTSLTTLHFKGYLEIEMKYLQLVFSELFLMAISSCLSFFFHNGIFQNLGI